MIIKMQYISLIGHMENMQHVVESYLSRFDIQLEKSNNHGLMEPFTALNPYSATLQKAETLSPLVGAAPLIYMPLSAAKAVNTIEEAHAAYELRSDKLRTLEENLRQANEYIRQLEDFTAFKGDLSTMENFEFLHYRFGKLQSIHFLQYEKFLSNNDNLIFHIIKRDKDFVWGIYFTPKTNMDAMDSIFASLKFEPIPITSTCLGESMSGTPSELINHWQAKCQEIKQELHQCALEFLENPKKIAIACRQIKSLYNAFDIKKFANVSPQEKIFSFSGWMPAADANRLEAEIDRDDLTIFSYDTFNEFLSSGENETPPTLLKNPPIMRQFEFFTKLYGLPTHGEIDPTPFLAVTYTILFGLMFGDVGHGFSLAAIGLFVWHKYKIPLGAIMAIAGTSAAFFGILYGSIFGFENILPALWRRPAEDIAGTLMLAVWIGVGLIVFSMVINMFNSFKRRDISNLLFGANGIAGLVFYGAKLFILVRVFILRLSVTWLVVVITILPLVFITFKHPLERFISGKKPLPSTGVGQFIFNTIIELFETLLTYATNTISFVRVGAFAISHAGMMHVVLQLSQGAAGTHNWLILIVGNILVLVIEGLLVGIQVLRLDFYEMFSRFYKGGGRDFVPSRIK